MILFWRRGLKVSQVNFTWYFSWYFFILQCKTFLWPSLWGRDTKKASKKESKRRCWKLKKLRKEEYFRKTFKTLKNNQNKPYPLLNSLLNSSQESLKCARTGGKSRLFSKNSVKCLMKSIRVTWLKTRSSTYIPSWRITSLLFRLTLSCSWRRSKNESDW